MVAALFLTWRIVDPSIATGRMGAMLPLFAIPVMSVALVGWAVATHRMSNRVRRASMVAVLLLACAAFALVRTAGVGGGRIAQLHWRWTPTPEDRLLAAEAREPALVPPATVTPPVVPPSAAAAAEPSGTCRSRDRAGRRRSGGERPIA